MSLPRRTLLATPGIAIPGKPWAAFHDRPIRLVVSFGGGGQTDIASRVTADAPTRALGQPVPADNRPGGAGNTAADAVGPAPPEVIARLSAVLGYAIGDGRVCAAHVKVGASVAPVNTPAEFNAKARAEGARWAPLIRRLNLVAE